MILTIVVVIATIHGLNGSDEDDFIQLQQFFWPGWLLFILTSVSPVRMIDQPLNFDNIFPIGAINYFTMNLTVSVKMFQTGSSSLLKVNSQLRMSCVTEFSTLTSTLTVFPVRITEQFLQSLMTEFSYFDFLFDVNLYYSHTTSRLVLLSNQDDF